MRISEILSFTPSSIDFEDALLTIERQKRSDGAVQQLPLLRDLTRDLRIYIEERDREPDEPIIGVHRKTAWKWTRDIGEEVLDRKVTPHLFRHGRAYYLLSRDVFPGRAGGVYRAGVAAQHPQFDRAVFSPRHRGSSAGGGTLTVQKWTVFQTASQRTVYINSMGTEQWLSMDCKSFIPRAGSEVKKRDDQRCSINM